MHVSGCICIMMYKHVYKSCPSQCMYIMMYVYACIRMYMMYLHVFCMYMHVFPEMTPLDSGTDATTPKHCFQGWQSAGHTQGTPGHLSIHFFQPSAQFVQTRFGAPQHAARVQGHWSRPLAPHSGLPCKICILQSSCMASHSRSSLLASIQMPEGVGCTPSKTPPDSDLMVSVYVCIQRICMYINVYACICMYIRSAQVNACICMYACI